MKDERKQCKKHHESTIGKIIYGFLLFLPLFAIVSACLISTFNMASKEESEIHYKYATNEVNSANDLVIGRAYHFEITNEEFQLQGDDSFELIGEILYTYNIEIKNFDDSVLDQVYLNGGSSSYPSFILYCEVDSLTLTFYIPSFDNYVASFVNWDSNKNYKINLDFVLTDFNNINELIPFISKCENIPIDYVETHNVSAQDVFYDSVDKVQQSPLFNWTTNTDIYTVLNNTCNSLGITTTFVPLLLAYWLIISVMYFLYDIVLIILNILHRKIHEVQESI